MKKVKREKKKQAAQAAKVIQDKGIKAGSTESFIYWLAFVGLWALIFFPPYFRGLFFVPEQYYALIFAVIVFSLWWFYTLMKKGLDIMNNPMDWFVFGLLASYIIAYFGAVNQKLAVVEIIKHLLYFNVFWLASRLLLDYKGIVSILHVIIFSALGVAAAGIFTAMDWIYIKDGFVDGRFYSTLQYANTLGSYLLAVVVLVIGLWQNAHKNADKWYKYFYAGAAYVLLLVFFGTNSRGAFLLLPVVLVLTLANPWLKQKLDTFILWSLLLVGSLGANYGFIPNIVGGKLGLAWLWFFMGLAVVILCQYGLEKVKDKGLIKESLPQGKIVLGILAVLFLILIFSWQFVLPDQMVDRLKRISFEDVNTGLRIYWSLEAFKMVKENPLFGLGGGVWEASHMYFQGFFYKSTQVHNDFAQTLMEAGYVGLTFFVGLWIVMLYLGFKNFKALDEHVKNVQWVVLVAALSLGAHAFIDFDLALSAVTIALFVLFGITTAMYRWNHPGKTAVIKARTIVLTLTGLALVVQLVLAASLAAGDNYAKKGAGAYGRGNIDDAISYFEKAKKYDPFAAGIRIDLAGFYQGRGEEEKAAENIQAAVARDRYSWKIQQKAGQIYWNLGRMDKAVYHLELARDNYRWNQEQWDILAQAYAFAGIKSIEAKDYALAQEYLEKVAAIPGDINARMASLGEWENRLWIRERLKVSPDIFMYSGIGSYFTGDMETAGEYLQQAVEGNVQEALWWLVLVKEKQGMVEDAVRYYEQAQEAEPGFEDNFWAVKNMQDAWFNR